MYRIDIAISSACTFLYAHRSPRIRPRPLRISLFQLSLTVFCALSKRPSQPVVRHDTASASASAPPLWLDVTGQPFRQQSQSIYLFLFRLLSFLSRFLICGLRRCVAVERSSQSYSQCIAHPAHPPARALGSVARTPQYFTAIMELTDGLSDIASRTSSPTSLCTMHSTVVSDRIPSGCCHCIQVKPDPDANRSLSQICQSGLSIIHRRQV